MDIVIGGMRNVLRNPLRLLLVVFLLGASLMLVAAMVSLNSSAQQQLANAGRRATKWQRFLSPANCYPCPQQYSCESEESARRCQHRGELETL